MSEAKRIVTHIDIQNIAISLGTNRAHLMQVVERSVGETVRFSQAASQAIGEISYSEAVEGIIEFFRDEMRKKI